MVFQAVARHGLRHPGAELDFGERSALARTVPRVVVPMNMISSFRLYSGRHEIAPPASALTIVADEDAGPNGAIARFAGRFYGDG